ncbi:restriction endonuclease subunit S [Vibrio vulnificus]|uniref:restriction endonuclease subunit S n=1 Tax=Vibrio vulnificus TaxID=672 RepID=UPI001A1CC988|nr:restriction endonuclease subunit S [Vibrio vulnificus]MDS1844250.1 restriction endonuclease subunit S [Vibrio vulnificus]HAS8283944.1 restriction endonuclease subunit S [Vibrio vulnificus]
MSWPIVTLGEVAVFINGDRGKNYPSKGSFVESGVAFINAGSLSLEHRVVDSELNFITQDKYDSLRSGKIERGDILFCLRGSLGKFAVIENDLKGAIASSLVIIRANDKITLSYLKHYLGSVLCAKEIDTFENGAAQPNLSATDLKSFKIPLPPLDEQKRIAAILDKADAIRQKRKQAIALADEFLRSVFLEMFGDPVTNPKGWEVKTLTELTTKITDGTHKTPSYTDTGVPFLSAKNIKPWGLDFEDTKFISREEHEQLIKRCNPELGDILLSKSGSLGTPAIVDTKNEFSLFESAALFKLNKALIEAEFLYHFIRSEPAKCMLLKNTKGVAIKHLHLKELRELKIIYPPRELREDFIRVAEQVKRFVLKSRLSDLESVHCFDSLSQKAFSGQL